MTLRVFLRPLAIFLFFGWKSLFQAGGDTLDGEEDQEKNCGNYG
jgi:hypothetical protein